MFTKGSPSISHNLKALSTQLFACAIQKHGEEELVNAIQPVRECQRLTGETIW